MDRNRRFWNRTAERYFNQPVGDEASYEHKLEKTREYLTPDSEALEFGCGTGGTAVKHAPFVKHYLATDIAEEMLNYGRERTREAGVENVTFLRADFDTLDVEPERFDVVLGLSIVHLMKDPDAAIAKAYSLLKPGGVFITSTVCILDGFWFLIPIIPVMQLFGQAPHVALLTGGSVRRSMQAAGFGIEYDWRPGAQKALFLVCRKPG